MNHKTLKIFRFNEKLNTFFSIKYLNISYVEGLSKIYLKPRLCLIYFCVSAILFWSSCITINHQCCNIRFVRRTLQNWCWRVPTEVFCNKWFKWNARALSKNGVNRQKYLNSVYCNFGRKLYFDHLPFVKYYLKSQIHAWYFLSEIKRIYIRGFGEWG